MSKRKLSRRQSWRSQKIQQERIRRAEKKQRTEPGEGQLGPEQPGWVIANYGVNLLIESESNELYRCTARQNLGSIVCGDHVVFQAIDDEEGVVVALLPRKSLLARPTYHGEEKAVAANIEQVFVVVAPAPAIQPLLIDRYLVASELAGLEACIVVNKIDLLGKQQRRQLESQMAMYENIGYTVLYLSTKQGEGLKALAKRAENRISILAGQSGVGKSSAIKALLPEIEIQIGEINEHVKLGRHTTTVSRLYKLPRGGAIIDSPGVRDFGLWQVANEDIIRGFREFAPHLGQCKFSNCSHQHEPGCALQQAVNDGLIQRQRLEHYHAIIETNQR